MSAGRGGCAARREQCRPLLRHRARHVAQCAVHLHHPQQEHDGAGIAIGGRNHERAGCVAFGSGGCRRGRAHGGDVEQQVAAELRWILLCLSLPLLAGIWWWTARRAGQIPGNSELREPTPSVDPPRHPDSGDDLAPEPAPQPRDWGVPPFEPLNIHTAEFDHVPVLDAPMMVGTEPAPTPGSVRAAAPAPAHAPTPPPAVRPMFTTGPISEHSDRAAAAPPQAPNAAELQRIVTVRVCAVGEARWSGSQLMAALELHGLAFGRYQVFHRKHADGRSLFCVASLIEPGTFDIAEMADQDD